MNINTDKKNNMNKNWDDDGGKNIKSPNSNQRKQQDDFQSDEKKQGSSMNQPKLDKRDQGHPDEQSAKSKEDDDNEYGARIQKTKDNNQKAPSERNL